ncbi:MAG TPA: DNA topoisomerase III, partial [Oxalobacteraceae bacterium]|nr:DNA topoisomerase III [Oxalobacteraceae bacterium]HCN88699.1 DNA topoisomerase III [Oxalobacteraceae bacterium]
EQMAKLLNEGKTDLLPGFVSQRTRRPFKAFLVKGKDGKVSFEFEERKPKAPAKGKATKAEEGAVPVAEDEKVEQKAEKTIKKTVKKTVKPAAIKPPLKKAVAKKPAPKKAA